MKAMDPVFGIDIDSSVEPAKVIRQREATANNKARHGHVAVRNLVLDREAHKITAPPKRYGQKQDQKRLEDNVHCQKHK